jgi:ABC-type phosphate transport system substrate-binding protein
MRVRSIFAGLATTAVVASSATLVAGAAHADPGNTPGDTAWVPDANDLVGVGSDTTENLMDFLADGGDATHSTGMAGYNSGRTAAAVRVASFDTVGSSTITLRSAGGDPTTYTITRPVGSGAGKALLYGAGNNANITFARSSSAINATEKSNGLQAFPYALDSLKMAVSGSTTSHAPASLTSAQILDIYKGNTTDWSSVGGTAGTIKPYVPQSGSGTYTFFMAQLQALNGGNPVTLGGSVDTANFHENTDDLIKDDANAIAPFSVAKRTLLYPTSIHLEGGWSAQRAVYNVVRGTDLADVTLGAELQAVFGEDGFICSTAARPLIEAAGFTQLATPAHGGVCGAATQDPTSNFTENQQVVTTTKVSATSKAARRATLKATITGSTAPSGSVDFYEGATLLQAGVPLISGQATYTATGTPGTHTFTAKFVPDAGSQFDPSQASKSVYVKTSSKVTESFPSSVKKGARAKGTVTVTLAGITPKATGRVKVMQGSKTLAKGTLAKGKVTLTLPRLSKGKHHLKATWGGDSHAIGSSLKFTITQK